MEDHAASSKASSSSPSSHRAEIEIKPKASLAPHARIGDALNILNITFVIEDVFWGAVIVRSFAFC